MNKVSHMVKQNQQPTSSNSKNFHSAVHQECLDSRNHSIRFDCLCEHHDVSSSDTLVYGVLEVTTAFSFLLTLLINDGVLSVGHGFVLERVRLKGRSAMS